MTIRVRPADVVVPPDDPFQNDLLDRKPSIEALTGLLGAVQGPCVLALDSKWGGGKTTFLRMWTSHLRKEGFFVADFNAWETDYSGEPFVAISTTLQEKFQELASAGRGVNVKRIAEDAKNVVFTAAPLVAGLAATAAFGSGALATEAVTHLASYAGGRLEKYRKGQEAIDSYGITLGKETLRISNNEYNGRSLFIMIDELDRCRPSYAVELLEVAKHLFSVDRIIFVLAVNRSQLIHSIKALYGDGFDAEGYLHRFFDLDYLLPWPDREKFVLQALRDSSLDALFQGASESFVVVPTLVARLLAWSHLDLRRISQACRRMALACASLGDAFPGVTTALLVACVLRALDSKLYHHLRDGDIPDKNIIDELYKIGNLKNLQHTPESCILEAVISAMWCDLKGGVRRDGDVVHNSPHMYNCNSTRDRLEKQSRDLGAGEELSEGDRRALTQAFGVINAAAVLSKVDNLGEYASVIRHIELFPSDESAGLTR